MHLTHIVRSGRCRVTATAFVAALVLSVRGVLVVGSANAQGSSFAVPKAVGYVNDYARVIPDSTRRSIEDALLRIRSRTEGEVVVVTRATLEGLDVSDMARRIGNAWGVGARSGRARQAGTIVLLIPKERSADGRGYCRIELGVGASAFIPDSVAASICIAATPAFRARRYGEALQGIVSALSKRYDAAFAIVVDTLPSVQLPPALDRVLRDYERAWRARDVAALVALFTDDGFVLQPGRAPARGRAALARVYEGQGGGALRLRALAYAHADSVGYIIGAYGYGNAPGDEGKFTLTLRRARDGRWLIASDMDNGSKPPR